MVLRKAKKSNKRQLSRKRKRTNTKKRRRVQKGGVYPNDAVRDDGTPITREEYIQGLKDEIGLTDEIIAAIEGDPNHSRDGVDHSAEFTGEQLLAFKNSILETLAEKLTIIQELIFTSNGHGGYIRDAEGIAVCKPWNTLSVEDKDNFEVNKFMCLPGIKHIQRYIIANSPPRPNGRVETMRYLYPDICKTLSVNFELIPPEYTNDISNEYMMLYFESVAKHPVMSSFFGEVLEKVFGPTPNSADAVAGDLAGFPQKDADNQGDY
jgi:hypothetical protein